MMAHRENKRCMETPALLDRAWLEVGNMPARGSQNHAARRSNIDDLPSALLRGNVALLLRCTVVRGTVVACRDTRWSMTHDEAKVSSHARIGDSGGGATRLGRVDGDEQRAGFRCCLLYPK